MVLVVGHLAAAALLLVLVAGSADPRDRVGFTRFYMRVWALFFLEYLLVPHRVPGGLTIVGRQVENKLVTVGPRGVDNLHSAR